MSASQTLWQLGRLLLVGVLLAILLLRLFEDRLVFFPAKHSDFDREPRREGLAFEDVWLGAPDGVELHGWYAAGAAGARLTLLLLHGNAGNLSHRIDNIEFLQRLPANVFALDYRGYGRSQGRPTEPGVYRDAETAYDYLVATRGVTPDRLVVLGQSLGTAVAAELATRRPVAGLILEAGLPSARRAAQRLLWLSGVRWVMRTQLDAAANLQKLRLPVLVAHCTGDPVLPYDLGEELFQAANEPKSFVRLEGECHEPLYIADAQSYARRLRSFLEALEAAGAKPEARGSRR